jgi:hypothetical protein
VTRRQQPPPPDALLEAVEEGVETDEIIEAF